MKLVKRIAFGGLAMLMAFSVVGCDNGIGDNSGGYDGDYSAGYQAGLAAGKADGYDDGYNAGYNDAYTDGVFGDGYSDGYKDGYAAAGGGGSGDVGGGEDEEEEIVGETDYSKVDPGTGSVTIYMDASQLYGAYVQGSAENRVKKAITDKFKADTGLSIDLNIKYETRNSFNTSFGLVMDSDSWDAAVGYIGQAGLTDTALSKDVTTNLNYYIEDFYNIRRAVDKKALNSATTLDNNMFGIPSVNKTKMRTILIRKDYMRQVGYTESAAEALASGGTLKHCRTLKDFDTMVRKMKAEISQCTMPIIATHYDMESTLLAGACGTAGYQYDSINYNADGSVKEVVPGWISEGYQEMLNWEYDWQKDGVWEANPLVKPMSDRFSDFASGKGAVYCVDPTVTNIIDVAKRAKAVNPSAEFTVLDPLDGDEEGSGAFLEVSRTSDLMIINKQSKNTELLLAYLDWMYSSVENYELCAYGIEGTHWEEAGDGFYKYPDSKKEQYEESAPYSGVFALLHNDELEIDGKKAYRLYDGYTETERTWIERAENAKTMKNPTDGMLMFNMTAQMSQDISLANADIYRDCTTKAWTGQVDPRTTYPAAVAAYKAQINYTSTDATENYIRWLTNQYKLYIETRK